MVLSLIKSLFGRAAAPPAGRHDGGTGLRAYLARLAAEVDDAGYVLIHARDMEPQGLWSRPRTRHAEAVAYQKRCALTDPFLFSAHADIRRRIGGCVLPGLPIPVVLLPDEEGLLDRFAAFAGLNRTRLAAAGITDFDIYAQIFIHEAAHVCGNDRGGGGPRFTPNEFFANALHTGRYLKHGGSPRAAAALGQCLSACNLFYTLLSPGADSAHATSGSAIDWMRTRIDSPDWDAARDGLSAAAERRLCRFAHPGVQESGIDAAAARRAIDRYIDIDALYERGGRAPLANAREMLALRDAALAGAGDLRRQGRIARTGPDENLRGALILQKLGRHLDALLADYCAVYRPAAARTGPPAPMAA